MQKTFTKYEVIQLLKHESARVVERKYEEGEYYFVWVVCHEDKFYSFQLPESLSWEDQPKDKLEEYWYKNLAEKTVGEEVFPVKVTMWMSTEYKVKIGEEEKQNGGTKGHKKYRIEASKYLGKMKF